jgi:predicted Zn finger-like uncharacterized protein
MIVTCEHCHTRYLVAAHLLLPEGRRVRCAGCHHEWLQPPTEDEDESDKGASDSGVVDDLPDLDPLPPMDDKFDDKDDFDDLPDLDSALNKKDSFADILDTLKPEPEERLPVHIPKPQKKVRNGGGVVGSVLTAIMLFCAVAAGLYQFRGDVMRLWQPSFAIYDALHIAVPMAGQGLAIDKVEAAAQADGSVKVTGRIINLTGVDTVVPKISLVVRGADGTELTQWNADAPVPLLHKESDTVFESTHPAIPDAAQDIRVGFGL